MDFLMRRVLQKYQQTPKPAGFVYLRRVAATPADYNPYSLRVSQACLPPHDPLSL